MTHRSSRRTEWKARGRGKKLEGQEERKRAKKKRYRGDFKATPRRLQSGGKSHRGRKSAAPRCKKEDKPRDKGSSLLLIPYELTL